MATRVLGIYNHGGTMPLVYDGPILRSEHLSVDWGGPDACGPIAEWYEAFLPALERAILDYPAAGNVAGALRDGGWYGFPLHFHPITKTASDYYLTITFLDGALETPFFAYLDAFALRFIQSNPPPFRMYCLLEIKPEPFFTLARRRAAA